MPNEDEDLDLETEDGDLEPGDLIKRLRAENRKLAKEAKESGAAKRELAFAKAGIDTSTKLGQMFVRSFEGDITNLDAIKAEATEIGLLKAETPGDGANSQGGQGSTSGPGADGQAGDDAASTDLRNALATGALGDTGEGVDNREQSFKVASEAISKGATYEEGAGSMLALRARAAAGGDKAVLVQEGAGV